MGEEYHKVLCIIGTGTIVHVWGCDEQNSSSPRFSTVDVSTSHNVHVHHTCDNVALLPIYYLVCAFSVFWCKRVMQHPCGSKW